MSVKNYKRKIEREVDQVRALAGERVLEADLDEETAVISISSAGVLRHEDDLEQVRETVADAAANPQLRAAALEGLSSAGTDEETAHEAALERLQDPDEQASLKKLALQLLKQATFSSPSADAWRPAFLEAVRQSVSSDDGELRLAALEVLCQEKDRYSQQLLVDGLRDPSQAIVPAAEALALLGNDVHAEVQQLAASIADDPPDSRARLEALLLLTGDPGSVDRFADLLVDSGEASKVRQLAATALSTLAPERFRAVARELEQNEGLGVASAESTGADALLLHTAALLELDG